MKSKNKEELSYIKNFPVFIGDTSQKKELDIFEDLIFDICKNTGMIQLRKNVDPKLVYSHFHSENIGEVWNQHHALLSEIIKKYSKNKKILEIGGSDSRLALMTLNEDIKKWTIVDPIPKAKIINEKLEYIEAFFSEDILHNYEYDTIIHSHLIEHIIDPSIFLESISNSLKDGNYHIFSIPNLYKWLKNKAVNTLTFEHILFLTEEFVDYMLSCHNFSIVEKIYYNEHSIFYVTKKEKTVPLKSPNKYTEYKKLYLSCFNYYKEYVNNLNEFIEKTDKDVYLFGGAFTSQYLISIGLNTSKIKCILDNSKMKNGKRLYGTDLIIKSPTTVNLNENSLIILKIYSDEIKKQFFKINPNIQFYEEEF